MRCSSRLVVFPTALTTTTTRLPREYSRATDATARPILFGFDKLDPPNLTISRRRRRPKERLPWRTEERGDSWTVRIWFLCLVAEDGLDAALMPVKMTTHRLHTSNAALFTDSSFLGLRNALPVGHRLGAGNHARKCTRRKSQPTRLNENIPQERCSEP